MMSADDLVEGRGRVDVFRQQGGSGRRRSEPVSKPTGAAGVRGSEAVQHGGRNGSAAPPRPGRVWEAAAESGGRAARGRRADAGMVAAEPEQALLTRVSARELCTGDPFVILSEKMPPVRAEEATLNFASIT